MKKWKVYEKLIALLTSEEYSNTDFTVIPNAKIKGYISDRKRQIDVLVDYRYDSKLSRRIIIDAKFKKRPIDIKEIEAFEGLMKDVRAHRGILVCSNGHTKSALRRAQQHIGIKLISESEIDDFSLSVWDNCYSDKCKNGLVLWDNTPGVEFNKKIHVHSLGKCDVCGEFHVWCWGCGRRKSLDYETEWKCFCDVPWFWLTAIENEEDEIDCSVNEVAYLLFVSPSEILIMDRRPF